MPSMLDTNLADDFPQSRFARLDPGLVRLASTIKAHLLDTDLPPDEVLEALAEVPQARRTAERMRERDDADSVARAEEGVQRALSSAARLGEIFQEVYGLSVHDYARALPDLAPDCATPMEFLSDMRRRLAEGKLPTVLIGDESWPLEFRRQYRTARRPAFHAVRDFYSLVDNTLKFWASHTPLYWDMRVDLRSIVAGVKVHGRPHGVDIPRTEEWLLRAATGRLNLTPERFAELLDAVEEDMLTWPEAVRGQAPGAEPAPPRP